MPLFSSCPGLPPSMRICRRWRHVSEKACLSVLFRSGIEERRGAAPSFFCANRLGKSGTRYVDRKITRFVLRTYAHMSRGENEASSSASPFVREWSLKSGHAGALRRAVLPFAVCCRMGALFGVAARRWRAPVRSIAGYKEEGRPKSRVPFSACMIGIRRKCPGQY